ncbi:hypothetical protein HPB50_021500 [Hyalomma asiaticum]|uniref:Uncharacterized protein n=1 Tax=Hyalomma asiaticum TaxID=266040 RepID=A0ACB7SH44_HYAAI|nr:hypothetical protein HPB50_021500 [Hyalomma asiaticum]
MTTSLPQDCCWSIPAVAMCVSFLLCMTQSSTGYLYVLFMEKYRVNREMASWPESIIMLTQNLGGFVVTVLHSKIPIFYVALFSATLCTAGLVGAAFAPDMTWMSVLLGGVYGTGSGASIISFTVFTMLYFDKYRATATSCKYIGWAASGLAGPLVFSAAVSNYGLGGSLLIGAAIALNALPLAMFLRQPRPLALSLPCRRSQNLSAKHDKTSTPSAREMSDGHGPGECLKNTKSVGSTQKCKANFNVSEEKRERAEMYCDSKGTADVKSQTESSRASSQVLSTTSVRGSSAGISDSQHMSGEHGSNCRKNTRVSSGSTAPAVLQALPSKSSKSILAQLTIFGELAFYVLLIVYALCDCAVSMHTTTIVDYGRDKGSALEDAKLVLTYNAAGQFIGRTLLPFASDNVANSRCPVAVGCFVGAGAWLALMPVVQSLPAFVTLNLVLGVCQGYVTCIRSVLVNDYCGVERLPTFFGILGLALVPLSFSGPTIIGEWHHRKANLEPSQRFASMLALPPLKLP